MRLFNLGPRPAPSLAHSSLSKTHIRTAVPLLSVEEAASVMEQAGGMAKAEAAMASHDAFGNGQGVAMREILTIMELAKDAGGEGGVTREVFGDCARVVGRGT